MSGGHGPGVINWDGLLLDGWWRWPWEEWPEGAVEGWPWFIVTQPLPKWVKPQMARLADEAPRRPLFFQ